MEESLLLPLRKIVAVKENKKFLIDLLKTNLPIILM